jgi:hypothetical protein
VWERGRLRAALQMLNPHLAAEAIAAAVEKLTQDRAAMDPAAANRHVYGLLKDGVAVLVPYVEDEKPPHPGPLPKAEREKSGAPLPGRGGEEMGSAYGGLKSERVQSLIGRTFLRTTFSPSGRYRLLGRFTPAARTSLGSSMGCRWSC